MVEMEVNPYGAKLTLEGDENKPKGKGTC